MDELLDFIPGGPWILGAVALLAVPGVRRNLRPLAKAGMKAGMGLVEQVKSLTAEAREQASDLYAEAKSERDDDLDNANGAAEGTPVRSRSRRVQEPAPGA